MNMAREKAVDFTIEYYRDLLLKKDRDVTLLSQTLAGKNRELEKATATIAKIKFESDREILHREKVADGVEQRLSQIIYDMEVRQSFLIKEMSEKEDEFNGRCDALNEGMILVLQKLDDKDSFLKKVLCFSVRLKWRILSEGAIRIEENRLRHEDLMFAMKDVMKPKILRIKNKMRENERKMESMLKTFNERSKITLTVRDQSEHVGKTSFEIMDIMATQSQSIQHRYRQKAASSFPLHELTSTFSDDQQLVSQSSFYNG